jgi:hypothetical protein
LREIGFIILLLGLGVLNFGWIIWPKLGVYAGAVQGAIFWGVLIAGGIARFLRR